MLLIQFQETLGIGFFSWKISESISNLLLFFPSFLSRSTYLKHLCNPSPLLLKPFIHLGARPNFSRVKPPMSFLNSFVITPFIFFRIFILKKIFEIFEHPWLILFHDSKII